MVQLRYVLTLAIAAGSVCAAAERTVDPTFLRRNIADVKPAAVYVATDTCEYRPLFGQGDSVTSIVRGVARFGEITVRPGGACNDVQFDNQEEIYIVMDGAGQLREGSAMDNFRPPKITKVAKNDFLYLPAGLSHGLGNSGSAPLRVIVAGYKLKAPVQGPGGPASIANLDEVKKQTVGGHPDSVLYQLMMGDTKSTRDRLATAQVMVSLYVMNFAPGGTNFPHHHDNEEEIYVLLDGKGDMVAGSGMNGVEARYPAKPGDAYFFRLNCTVGFYNSNDGPARILALRSTYPRR
jgi:mannose-6-phosphate isomerase-like protein (cupin superfamily)